MTSPPDGRESRPGENRAATISVGNLDVTSVPPSTPGNVHARRRWAYVMVSRCSEPPPAYGSAEFLALPDGDLRKVAAVIRAAENWATDGDNLEENLRVEIETARAAHKALDDAEYVARRDAHRAASEATSYRPHPANRRGPAKVVCITCGTPTSPWSCSCGLTRVDAPERDGAA